MRFSEKITLGRLWLGTLAGWLLCLGPAQVCFGDIPPSPANQAGSGNFIHDFAGLLNQQEMEQIGAYQQIAFEQHNTPIIVVTIRRMADYGHRGGVEPFAKRWFNAWNIGTLEKEHGANQGILLLISAGDRKARIELGADWGRHWDAYCQQVMNGRIVPLFKQGDFAGGISSGVIALAEMAAAGPDGTKPNAGRSSVPVTRQFQRGLRGDNPGWGRFSILILSLVGVILISLASVGLVIAGICLPEYRKWLIGIGVLMFFAVVCFPLFPVVVIVILRLMLGNFGGGSSFGSYSSGGYSGGGFSGGFSGGGGATGSW